ncbi:hypothetical protein GCM10009785_05980 [Brooklawnia cerclae]|uniref:Uncharacterized protein n=1 Tax=Brooklawnia cerclae TaxID=349934 RepID=A0ABX0SBV8_9ACTN|nr:hypothetical protein [Brooklawnia cerclae]NIH55809.1 hypothetical protein [Brooklawnia cerclae]
MVGWGVVVAGIAIVAVVLAITLTCLAVARSRRAVRPGTMRLDPLDDAALAAAFARIEQEDLPQRVTAMAAHLTTMVARKVPLRYVRPSARSGIARLGFADGTVVLAQSLEPASLGVLARQCWSGTVQAEAAETRDESVYLDLGWPSGRITVRVLGRDQAD